MLTLFITWLAGVFQQKIHKLMFMQYRGRDCIYLFLSHILCVHTREQVFCDSGSTISHQITAVVCEAGKLQKQKTVFRNSVQNYSDQQCKQKLYEKE